MDLLLLGGTVFFALLLVAVAKWSPDDGQVFQAIATLASGFGASFMTRAKPSDPAPKPDTKTVKVERTDTTTGATL